MGCKNDDLPIIQDQNVLPVVKLQIEDKYLWSENSGLYVVGSNGISYADCPMVANFNQKWEYPAKISFYENKELVFADSVGFRIKGKCSRQKPMKSIGLYWRKEYGKKNLKHQLFPDQEIKKYKRLFLRNSGNDFGITHLRDAAITEIIKDFAKVDYQAYRPSVLYLNGQYWGIYNMREMITPHHFKYHYDVDDDTVDLLEGSEVNPEADDGSSSDYLSVVVDYLNNNDLSVDTNYNQFGNLIEIDSYIDYIIINTYVHKTDWPLENVKWWRDKTSSNHRKWRWVVHDSDWGFRKGNEQKLWIGNLYKKDEEIDKIDGFFIFNHLIKNKKFRNQFLERYKFYVEKVFEEQRVASIILQLKDKIAPEYNNHQKKWNTISYSKWEDAIQELIVFNNQRNAFIKSVLITLENE
ncbi:MAG: CotH kinase family protein [Flavobacteriaceae bacterium]|nr:CotH kinase family protein [Flavobacteriaceae bacterium]